MNADRDQMRVWLCLCDCLHDLRNAWLDLRVLCDLHDNIMNIGDLMDVCFTAAAEKMKPTHF